MRLTESQALRDRLLVGRQDEVRLLAQRIEEALTGHTQVVLLEGAPGIGKTRLMQHVSEGAVSREMIVLRGGASEAEGMPPYLPFLEALGRHIREAAQERLRDETDHVAGVLEMILPELGLRIGHTPIAYALPAEQARLRLYESLGMFLAAIAGSQPILLILDDLHWADPATLELLCYIVRQQPTLPLLVLGASRTGEALHELAFNRAMAELNRLRILTTLTLEPLSRTEIAELVRDSLGDAVDTAVIDALATHSEGNPFFAEELLRDWTEAGSLVQRAGRWTWAGVTPNMPPGIAYSIGQRLTRLQPQTVELLRTAAIIGRRFEIDLLAEVVGEDTEEVEERLAPAVHSQVISSQRETLFSFTHDKIRECLYVEVTPFRRLRVHGLIGRTMEARTYVSVLEARSEAQRLAELAFHFSQSGDRERGVAYLQLAAEQAMRMYAVEEAAIHYRAALRLIHDSDERRGQLVLALGEACLLCSAEPEAADAFMEARRWYEQVGDRRREAEAAYRLGQARWRQEQIPQARDALEMARRLLRGESGELLVRVLVELASLHSINLNEQTEAQLLAREAVEEAERLQSGELLAAASRTLGNVLVRSRHLSEGTDLLERALALARTANAPVEAAECCSHLFGAQMFSGALRSAYETAQTWVEVARRCHDPYQLRHVYTWLAYCRGFACDVAGAEHWMAEAEEGISRLTSPQPRAWLTYCYGGLAYLRGEYDLAEEMMTQAIQVFRETNPDALGWYLGLPMMVQIEGGNRDGALESVGILESLLEETPSETLSATTLLVSLAWAALMLGDETRLERYYPRLLPLEGQFQDVLVDRLLGQIEAAQGDIVSAWTHLASAERHAREQDIVWELAHVLEAEADLASKEREGRERAGTMLREARDIYARCGNLPRQRLVQQQLDALGARTTKRPRLPAGLSPREVEVLQLVADGKTNRQIAAELVLSEKTVINHLTSIFNKTGTDNRAAATAFAIRNQLA